MTETAPSPEPDCSFVNLRSGAAAMVAANIVYLVAAQLLPPDCCEARKIAMTIAFGLPSAVFAMLVAHCLIFSASHYSSRARKIALWIVWILQGTALSFLMSNTAFLIDTIHQGTSRYFNAAVGVGVVLFAIFAIVLHRVKLKAPPPKSGAEES